jgi:hypothetical protein
LTLDRSDIAVDLLETPDVHLKQQALVLGQVPVEGQSQPPDMRATDGRCVLVLGEFHDRHRSTP